MATPEEVPDDLVDAGIGISLSVAGSFASALGLALIKYAYLTAEAEEDESDSDEEEEGVDGSVKDGSKDRSGVTTGEALATEDEASACKVVVEKRHAAEDPVVDEAPLDTSTADATHVTVGIEADAKVDEDCKVEDGDRKGEPVLASAAGSSDCEEPTATPAGVSTQDSSEQSIDAMPSGVSSDSASAVERSGDDTGRSTAEAAPKSEVDVDPAADSDVPAVDKSVVDKSGDAAIGAGVGVGVGVAAGAMIAMEVETGAAVEVAPTLSPRTASGRRPLPSLACNFGPVHCSQAWCAKFSLLVGNMLLSFVSSGFDMVALLFAPVELLGPLAGSTLILNIFVAPFITRERVYPVDVLATLISVPGMIIASVYGPHSTPVITVEVVQQNFDRGSTMSYEVAILSALVVTSGLAKLIFSHPEVVAKHAPVLFALRPFLFPCIAAMLGGQQLLITKLSVELIDSAFKVGPEQLLSHVTFFVLVAAVATSLTQLWTINQSLSHGPALLVVPVYQSLLIASQTLTSAVYFNQFSTFEWDQTAAFSVGVVLVVAGVLLLTQRPVDTMTAPPTKKKKKKKKKKGSQSTTSVVKLLGIAVVVVLILFISITLIALFA